MAAFHALFPTERLSGALRSSHLKCRSEAQNGTSAENLGSKNRLSSAWPYGVGVGGAAVGTGVGGTGVGLETPMGVPRGGGVPPGVGVTGTPEGKVGVAAGVAVGTAGGPLTVLPESLHDSQAVASVAAISRSGVRRMELYPYLYTF